MCIATPETLLHREMTGSGPVGTVVHAGKELKINLSLVPEAKEGDIVLLFRGSAIRVIDQEEAQKVTAALGALADVMDGDMSQETIEKGFADLIENPGQLPPHLAAQLKKEGR